MRVALISPKGLYKWAEKSDYHLALAQIEDNDYFVVYGYLSDDNYIIMDNGAAEGKTVTDHQLVTSAVRMTADEVVVPDVMCDFKGTMMRAQQFFGQSSWLDLPVHTRYMRVVQGTTLDEAYRCVDEHMLHSLDAVLGIPRHWIATVDRRTARAQILQYIWDNYGNEAEVHLLGTSYLWPREVYYIARNFPWVRGVDSSMPFNYTIAGEKLEDLRPIKRPDNYFDYIHNVDEGLLEYNINTFKEWASGTEGAGS